MTSILVVDDDPDIRQFIQATLELEGYDVGVARDGLEALNVIREDRPDLALIDVMMPALDGIEVCRRLRSDPSTASLPVIMLTAKNLTVDKVVGLQAGADDYVVKPFDTLELIARIRSTLRRNADMRAVSPLTGLPGNHRITDEIAARTSRGDEFAVCHVDLDNFKAFNDRYGWLRGDGVIAQLATSLKLAAESAGMPVPFIGHVGGDDFVIVCDAEQVEELCDLAINDFDAEVVRLHDPADVAAGHLTVVDRQGNERQFPLTSVSIGVATTQRRQYTDHRDVVVVATEMKAVAKARAGSAVAIDRRTDG